MIRTAFPQDAPSVAPLMFQAMSDIVFKLINRNDPKEATRFLEKLFIEKNNQYSYENTLVYEKDNQILGSLVYYNGAHIATLSQTVFDFVHSSYGHHIRLDPETQAGEYYIDTLSVSPKAQGKGIGASPQGTAQGRNYRTISIYGEPPSGKTIPANGICLCRYEDVSRGSLQAPDIPIIAR